MWNLFAGSGLTPHGFCLLWDPGLIWLQALSDFFIGVAYFSIPLALVALVHKRRDLAFGGMFWMFAGFIVACGATHFMSIVTLWQPAYWLEGWLKAATAVISVFTAWKLWPLIPQVVALPSPAALRASIVQLQAAEAKLKKANAWLVLAEKMGRVGHWHVDLPDRSLTWSQEVYEIYGVTPETFTPTMENALDFYDATEQALIRRVFEEALAGGGSFEQMFKPHLPNGEIRHVLCRGTVEFDPSGAPVSVFGVVVDKTDEYNRQQEIEARGAELATALEAAEANEARYRLLADHATDLVISVDKQLELTYASPSSKHLTGYEPEELTGKPVEMLVWPDEWPHVQRDLARLGDRGWADNIQFRARCRNGSALWIEANGRATADGANLILSMRDVSLRKEADDRLLAANAKLERIARLDALTTIPNRRQFDETLDLEMKRCTRAHLPLSLIMIDVDMFKAYNDIYGHPAGDRCLQLVAQAVAGFARRPGDLAARYGGEELAVILPDTANRHAAKLAEQIRNAVRNQKIEHSGNPAGCVTVSLGLASLEPPRRGNTTADLVERADAMLYAAKEAGRDRLMVATCLAAE